MQYQIAQLQTNRYGYETAEEKKRAQKRRALDVQRSIGQLYSQLTSALSKHAVIIRDLSALPIGATGGITMTGVYAGGN
jgi:hypothetical protein